MLMSSLLYGCTCSIDRKAVIEMKKLLFSFHLL